MEYMNYIAPQLQMYLPYLILGLMFLVLILGILVISLHSRLNGLKRRYARMMQGMEGVNIERMMIGHIDEVREAMVTVERLNNETKRLEQVLQSCLQKVGMVRFNAFEDTGSDLSFALAMLDDRNNGVVLSSLYGRNESRIYAKPVVNLQSSYLLSSEEQQAIRLAKDSRGASKPQIQPTAATVNKPSEKKITNSANGMLTREERDLLGDETRK